MADNQENLLGTLEYAEKRINKWFEMRESGKTKAELATLRKNLGKGPQNALDSWAILLDDSGRDAELIFENHSGNATRFSLAQPTKSGIALFYSLSFYAIHQQGFSDQWMNESGRKFGASLKQLAVARASGGDLETESSKIYDRLKSISGKRNLKMQMKDLRGIIALLHDSRIPIDYRQLTADLYWLQHPNSKNRVLIRWINEYNSSQTKETKK